MRNLLLQNVLIGQQPPQPPEPAETKGANRSSACIRAREEAAFSSPRLTRKEMLGALLYRKKTKKKKRKNQSEKRRAKRDEEKLEEEKNKRPRSNIHRRENARE